MEALSPRDANAQVRIKQPTRKLNDPAPIQLKREKDHPPPPPSDVREPPSSDRPDGAVYRTGTLLGKGGFAICYEGELGRTRQKYALKMVKSHMPQKKMEQKFQTELQIHSKMRHPNIVQFHRAFTFQQCTYIVLELCPNGSLMDVIKCRKFMTEPEVRFYTIQIAGGIKYMHAKGIIHRDLKMGNIFLDKDMNIKIGDFGLAALLMSGKDMSACRRTTLCGTPNYIAPEILEKGKKGHDHAVDIWSLGIIIFAMLTGKPPFQSTTAEEIYRRAREREYDWPKLDTSENYICQEAKDLVSTLLVDRDDRPSPDEIVQHPFFSCGWVPTPEEMLPRFKESSPSPNYFLPAGSRTTKANLFAKHLKILCQLSGVGPFSPSKKLPSSTYREMAAEEKAGLTPAVPLPENVVYRPFAEWLNEQVQRRNNEPASNTKAKRTIDLEDVGPPYPAVRPTPTAQRLAPQSFAAQQRAQNQPASTSVAALSQRSRPSPVNDQKIRKLQPSQESESRLKRALEIPKKQLKTASGLVGSQVPKAVAAIEARIGTDLVQELNQATLERQVKEKVQPAATLKPLSLFSEQESPAFMSRSKPEQILQSLKSFHAELERALNSRSIPPTSRPPVLSPAIVVKWVDYTNKFGLGYILNNGSVGCIFKSCLAATGSRTGRIPPTCVLVRNAERHLQSRENVSYPDRHQLVPVSGPPIEFYENRRDEGIVRFNVSPRKFSVIPGKDGEPGRLSRGRDEHDDRKAEKIVLWNKFAKYMIAFGRDQDCPEEDALERMVEEPGSGTVVTFYQRFGDVGCWNFNDGSFQFNFPDHTKIILSGGGTWCDFYHLPLEAARDLEKTGSLPASALDDRQHLRYPVQTLLNFMAKPKPARSTTRARASPPPPISPLIQGIPQANHFREKIEFIRNIMSEWIQNGGLGNSNMEPAGRLRWNGLRELHHVKVPYKHVWVTIGARARDDRRVAWFDPKKPLEIVPDIVV